MFRLAALLFVLMLAAPALAQTMEEVDQRIDEVLKNHVPYEAAYVDIKAAVEANDVEALSEYIPYGSPFLVNGKAVTLKDAEEFKARVGEFFNDKVKEAVLAQPYETLFVNADGVMFGVGQLWLSGICRDEACNEFDVKITAFNNG
ncbi:MAG TPA: hypothetical protein VG757_07585 [Devosia sp.]|nr:hypothetical protein [Devosia sp.]